MKAFIFAYFSRYGQKKSEVQRHLLRDTAPFFLRYGAIFIKVRPISSEGRCHFALITFDEYQENVCFSRKQLTF